ncbi:uncharacterized protein LOC142548519 [Primulina tabacum]|uniref:uncharacterized protein LOC142548519 n=1 Tax=Primulina tabacum TaxID=48773 RepID=UPI003F5A6B48
MVESSTLCISSFSSSVPICSEPMSLTFSFQSTPLPLRKFPFQIRRYQSSPRRFFVRASGSGYFPDDDDSFGLYPWQNSDTADPTIQWIREERVTLFTADGLIQIGGKLVPRRVSSSDKKLGKAKLSQRSQRFKDSNYMDPNQRLCLGALFDIAATNGLDVGRRLCIIGFCRSIEMLCDVVEDTVLEHGGEVVTARKASREGLHEKLTMIVAVPLLWGVPPASETLSLAVRSGGGIVDKVFWQWDFL